MIVVHWCIPDMSGLLRDQIRREAYVTNELIIQQETMRARGCATGEEAGSGEVERNPCAEWGHLTGSELDLAMMAHHELEVANAVQRRSAGEIAKAVQKRLAGEAYSSDHPVFV
jgi:anoctamin-1